MEPLSLGLGLVLGLGIGGGAVFLAWRLANRTAALAQERERTVLAEQIRVRDEQLAAERQRTQIAAESATAAQTGRATALAERTAAETRLGELAAALALRENDLAALRDRFTVADSERTRLAAALDHERRAAEERLAEAERARTALRAEFENLANRLLEEKGKALLVEQRSGLDALLTPLRERITAFEAQVARTYDSENRDRASLLDLLKRLDAAHLKLGKEAESLTRALTGEAKTQGDWGEMILENLLALSGLAEGREYAVQESHRAEDGLRHLRPDVVLHLPGDKAVVIDSKVAITAFVESTRADDPEARANALAAHRNAVRAHIKALAGKHYHDVVGGRALDFVLMFIPSEAAFHAVIAQDPAIYNEAFNQGIVLASPTTLLATLRVVAHVWRSERQNANAQKIAEEAGRMLEKLAGFLGDLDDLGAGLTKAQAGYEQARAKLATGKGNLVGRAQKLVDLGARLNRSAKVQDALGLAEAGAADEATADPPMGPSSG